MTEAYGAADRVLRLLRRTTLTGARTGTKKREARKPRIEGEEGEREPKGEERENKPTTTQLPAEDAGSDEDDLDLDSVGF